MADPNEIEVNATPRVLTGEDLLELRLVLQAFGAVGRTDFDVAITPTPDPASDGVEYHIVPHQP